LFRFAQSHWLCENTKICLWQFFAIPYCGALSFTPIPQSSRQAAQNAFRSASFPHSRLLFISAGAAFHFVIRHRSIFHFMARACHLFCSHRSFIRSPPSGKKFLCGGIVLFLPLYLLRLPCRHCSAPEPLHWLHWRQPSSLQKKKLADASLFFLLAATPPA